MSSSVTCGHCYRESSCSRCPRELRPASIINTSSAGCQGCAQRYDKTLTDLKNDLTERHGTEVNEAEREVKQLQAEAEREVKQLQAEINFLKLNNVSREPSSSNNLEGGLEIEVQGCVLQAHRLILADKSIVFRRMFEIPMVENETGVVRINDTTFPVMRAVIDFCYTAEISFTDEASPEDVLKTAHKYVIDHLRDIWATALVPKINDENLAEMLRLSKVCEAKELREAASQYLKTNFDRVLPSILDEVFSCLTFGS